MAPIRCSTCRTVNPLHVIGSKSEKLYMRVMDTRPNKSEHKMYFCCDRCYLDREFLTAVMASVGDEWRPLSISHARNEKMYAHAIEQMKPMYYSIVEEANRSHGLREYRLRNGIQDPFGDVPVPVSRTAAPVLTLESIGSLGDWADETH